MSGIPDFRDDGTALWTKRYGPALRRYFGRRANACDIDDLVQEVLLKMQSSATSATEVENPERYLFRVAHNVLVSRHRSEMSRGGPTIELVGEPIEIVDDISPERILIARDEYARARQAILNLPPRARAAFQFHRFDNMTYKEVAVAMGISRETVKELMHRAITGIAAEMAKADSDDA